MGVYSHSIVAGDIYTCLGDLFLTFLIPRNSIPLMIFSYDVYTSFISFWVFPPECSPLLGQPGWFLLRWRGGRYQLDSGKYG
jgi:hypothetical protein